MRRLEWGPLAVLVAVAALLVPVAFYAWLHLSGPSDGAWLQPGTAAWTSRGVAVTPLLEQPGGLRRGDVIVAMAGRGMDAWAAALVHPDIAHQRLHLGQTISETVLRGGRRLTVVMILGHAPFGAVLATSWGVIIFGLAFLLIAVFVFTRRPQDRAAQVLLVCAAGLVGSTPWSLGLFATDIVEGVCAWLYLATTAGVYMLLWIAALHFALIFPQRHPIIARHGWIIPLLYIAPYALQLVSVVTASSRGEPLLASNGALYSPQTGIVLVYVGLQVAATLAGYKRARGDVIMRQQLRWIVGAVTLSGILEITCWLLPGLFLGQSIITVNMLALCALPVPVAIAAAILRYHLFEIDIVLNSTLVYGTLTASIVGIYVGIVGSLGALFQARGSLLVSLLATGLVAVLFHPLRERLQRMVNRLMYGERDDPFAVLARLGVRLEATLSPEAVLPAIVETVAQALRLPYAAIALQQGHEATIVTAYGRPHGEPTRVPLVYQSVPVGQLILSPRAPGETFGAADQRLLAGLARQVGVAAHAVRLTADLQHSRERLVTAREEERRRLRRDLHDGLGPALAGFTLTVGAARNLLTRDPATADLLLADLGDAIEAAVGDIRRLVYNLRPPALDELGLAGALRARAAQYSAPAGTGGLTVGVEAPEDLPVLSAAVEVAAYRIVEEALTNVARHAQARRCLVRLSLAGALCLEIADDGSGLPAEHRAGVGLRSMRERAAELGGTCVVTAVTTGGTRVLARLPLPEE